MYLEFFFLGVRYDGALQVRILREKRVSNTKKGSMAPAIEIIFRRRPAFFADCILCTNNSDRCRQPDPEEFSPALAQSCRSWRAANTTTTYRKTALMSSMYLLSRNTDRAQELHDLAAAAELFAGDALCFATVTCLAAHLPYVLRVVALDQGREAIRRCGLPVSVPVADDGTRYSESKASGEALSDGVARSTFAEKTTPTTLNLERYRLGHFATGALTNAMQLQGWVHPPGSAVEDDGEDSADESDGLEWGGEPRGKNTALPYHPSFIDAAMLTLSTPKWPLILDPEGIALR